MPASYTGAEVNQVLRMVKAMSTDGDEQLSILTHALVIACKSTEVDHDMLCEKIDELWNRPGTLIPLPASHVIPTGFPKLEAIFWKVIENPTAPDGKIMMFHLSDPDTRETYMSLGVPMGRGDWAAFIAASCNKANAK